MGIPECLCAGIVLAIAERVDLAFPGENNQRLRYIAQNYFPLTKVCGLYACVTTGVLANERLEMYSGLELRWYRSTCLPGFKFARVSDALGCRSV